MKTGSSCEGRRWVGLTEVPDQEEVLEPWGYSTVL
jgi:hypothetical protein